MADLFVTWETEDLGAAFPRRTGWPWPWSTSHLNSWILTYDPDPGGVFATVGGGVRWERLNPRAPQEPHGGDMEPPDMDAWLRDPAAPPSVPLPLIRDPGTGVPTAAGRAPQTQLVKPRKRQP
ncbi:hypothetical protein [Saccharothrix deserti]|uniref:hypothetical protein n=1 Tax=Saccharothrix deserti TaxID=2593674 RepID=UPI001EE3A6CA|nr:hypothetical protein [Saccharothrix deserti]